MVNETDFANMTKSMFEQKVDYEDDLLIHGGAFRIIWNENMKSETTAESETIPIDDQKVCLCNIY